MCDVDDNIEFALHLDGHVVIERDVDADGHARHGSAAGRLRSAEPTEHVSRKMATGHVSQVPSAPVTPATH